MIATAFNPPYGTRPVAVRRLHESVGRYGRPSLRERELTRLWELQQLPPESLVTTDGREVRVAFRGRRGTGAGPDFRDAVIALDGVACQGDVELHIRASDFFRHGHAADRAYQRLLLHVVYRDDAPVRLEDGRLLPALALESWVRRRAGELRAALGGTAEYREPCHAGVAALGQPGALAVLRQLGEQRLRRRAAALAELIAEHGAEETLYRAIARALGVTRNGEPMSRLAAALPLVDLRALAEQSGEPGVTLRAALLGAAGLLEGQLSLWPEGDDAPLIVAWRTAGSPSAAGLHWADGAYRRGGSPRERLSGLARLLEQPDLPFAGTLAAWRTLLDAGAGELLKLLQVPQFIGRDRALELAVNAVLPWLLARYGGTEEQAVLRLFATLPPVQPYGSSSVLRGALALDGTAPAALGAQISQGMVQMTREWCTQGGCGRCPLSPAVAAPLR